MMDRSLSVRDKIVLAAARLVENDLDRRFSAEDLVVAAWELDPVTFGLRGHAQDYPDSNRLYSKIDGKGGLVDRGYLEKVAKRTFQLTARGLARALEKTDLPDREDQAKLERIIQRKVSEILSHPSFKEWLDDPAKPSKFRGAGHFWGVAPGTPASVVRSRVHGVERVLKEALSLIESRGLEDVLEQRGKALFDRVDIERALEFQGVLKERFQKDLRYLDPKGDY